MLTIDYKYRPMANAIMKHKFFRKLDKKKSDKNKRDHVEYHYGL